MIESLVYSLYCFAYVTDQIPLELILYTHLPPALLAVLFGSYVAWKARGAAGWALQAVCVGFALWCALDLVSWFVFLGSAPVMFAWSLLDLTALLFFAAAYWFLHAFLHGASPPAWQLSSGLLLIAPTAAWTALGLNLTGFDADTCEALEHAAITLYPYVVEGIFIIAAAWLAFRAWRSAPPERKTEIVLAATGVLLFLVFFMGSTLAVSVLVNETAVEFAYNFEIYGLLGMPVLLGFLGYLIVRYHAFKLKVFGAQALVAAVLALIASEFAFVVSPANRILVAVTLALTAAAGVLLVRSVGREIQQRERIERLAADLKASNGQLSEFMSLATHEIRNPATFIKGVAANALQDDLGPLSPSVRDAFQKTYLRAADILTLGSQYLNKSKLELDQLSYTFQPVDLGRMVEELVMEIQPAAEQRGISVSADADPGAGWVLEADQGKLKEVIGNLIDNAIKYTPKGSVAVSLSRAPETLTVRIADTGVGIPAAVVPQLFKKFSRADAQKANLLGTGLGLYLAKVFVEAHHGRIWVESDGAGRGSTFMIELPIRQPSAAA